MFTIAGSTLFMAFFAWYWRNMDEVNAKLMCRQRKKVHASFSSRMASVTMLEVADAIQNANYTNTTQHDNRRFTKDNWWEEWRTKAEEADVLLVLFVPEYKLNFSEALYREAQEIIKIHVTAAVLVFLLQGGIAITRHRYLVPKASYFQSRSKSIYDTASRQS